MSDQESYVIGVDFGTLSGRAVVVRVSDGAELGTGVFEYPHAVMESTLTAADNQQLGPDWALQNAQDYVDVLRNAVPKAVEESGIDPQSVVGIATDFTACTVLPVTADGTPLSDLDEFRNNPHSWVKLWKHHAAGSHADRINELAHARGEAWISRYGGLISSEWAFAKALQVFEDAPEVYDAMDHWIEAADWIVWQLGGRFTRNACTAGYKGIYQDGQYPSAEFLNTLSEGFGSFVEDKFTGPIVQLGEKAGELTAEAAAWTGLPQGIAVATGNVDAHVTAPAAQAVEPGQLVMIMGTSTCHVVSDTDVHEVPGMCGAVDGGIIAGQWGFEAGQSGVGDIFAWFVKNCVPAAYTQAAEEAGISIHEYLTSLAEEQVVGQHGLVALDWHSGNRSVLVDHQLSGGFIGQSLATKPEDQYRALIEATAFGTRTIVEAFEGAGLQITEVIGSGGLLRNPFLMQVYSDVLNRPISLLESEQGPALGSAIHAAVAAGEYPDVAAAAAVMGHRTTDAYTPNAENARAYERIFALYTRVHDYFGREQRDIMHELKQLRREAFEKED